MTEFSTTYSGDRTKSEHRFQHEWEHPMGALMEAGLCLDFFREHESLP